MACPLADDGGSLHAACRCCSVVHSAASRHGRILRQVFAIKLDLR